MNPDAVLLLVVPRRDLTLDVQGGNLPCPAYLSLIPNHLPYIILHQQTRPGAGLIPFHSGPHGRHNYNWSCCWHALTNSSPLPNPPGHGVGGHDDWWRRCIFTHTKRGDGKKIGTCSGVFWGIFSPSSQLLHNILSFLPSDAAVGTRKA